MNLGALAERVERLTGPCRETDCLIFESGHRLLTPERRGTIDGEPTGEYFDLDGNALPERAPRYTASLDAAMSLVVGDPYWAIDQRLDHWIAAINYPGMLKTFRGKAKTEVQSRLAAILRARASMEADHG